jgi:hypothetical protein
MVKAAARISVILHRSAWRHCNRIGVFDQMTIRNAMSAQ